MILKNILKIIIYFTICLVIAVPVAALLILYYYKFWILDRIPAYLFAAIIAIVFAVFAVNLQPLLDKIFKRKQEFQDMSGKSIKDKSYTGPTDNEEWSRQQFASSMLDLSSEILSKSVPDHLPKIAGISFGAFYIPRYREGIDYFDIIKPTNYGAGVIATEISGRGINNAIYSVILRSAFHACIEEAHSTFSIMQKLNKTLYAYTNGEGGTVKAYYFYYDISARRVTFTNAGYEPMEIYRVDKNIFESLDTEGSILGVNANMNFGMGRTNLLLGDIGFLYSKALVEAENKQGEKFGLTQLRRIIKENRFKNPTEIADILREAFTSFIGSSSFSANILVIVFKV